MENEVANMLLSIKKDLEDKRNIDLANFYLNVSNSPYATESVKKEAYEKAMVLMGLPIEKENSLEDQFIL